MAEISKIDEVQSKIYTIRGMQVMIDKDLAELYGVETKRLNEAVKRNSERFPQKFCFMLNSREIQNLRSQFATSSWGGRRYKYYVFTEHGVSMLSSVLKSEIAIRVSIQIIDAFIVMRKFLQSSHSIYQRVYTLESKQIETDKKVDKVLNAMENKELQPKQKIFYNGQVFDAYQFVSKLFRSADKSIIIIDNYIDDTVLTHLDKRKKDTKAIIYTKSISKQLLLDVEKYNEQYQAIELIKFKNSHDRFIIIDDSIVYHFGASLKDLGKKWFAFSKMDIGAVEMLGKLKD